MKKFFLLNIFVSIFLFLTFGFSEGLALPFSSNMGTEYKISEGYIYGSGEQAIHGKFYHGGIDYSLPYGTPVYSPTDGYILASYHDEMLNKFFSGSQIHYGRGWHVVIFSPESENIVLLGHLSSISSGINIIFPTAQLNKNMKKIKYSSKITNISRLELLKNFVIGKNLKKIQKGDFIGTVGNSGLGLGTDFIDPFFPPIYPNIAKQQNSWDEPHIHMEIYNIKNGKKTFIDPYGVYKTADFYQKYFGPNYGTMFDFSGASIEFAKYETIKTKILLKK